MMAKLSYNRNFGFGAPKRKLWRLGNPFILAVTLLLVSSYLTSADSGFVPAQPRYRVFALKHISVERAKKFLADAKLGTVSQLPATNMILVTAQPRQLIKASAILKLVDAGTVYVCKAFPVSAAKNLPSNEQIAAEVGNISIGSFSNPPSGAGAAKAIIDVHDDAVIAIAPADQLEKIIEAIERYASNSTISQLQKAEAEALQPAQPTLAFAELSLLRNQEALEPALKEKPKTDRIAEAELERLKAEFGKVKANLNNINASSKSRQAGTNANNSEPNEFFERLLDSLAEAEKKMEELTQPVPGGPEPNEPAIQPGTLVTAPEKSAPNEPAAGLKQPEETAVEAVKPPEKPDIIIVPATSATRKTTAKPPEKPDIIIVPATSMIQKTTAKPPPEPKPETAPEQVTVEIEEPNQAAPILQEEPETVTKVVEPPVAPIRSYQPETIANGDDTLELDMPPKINIIDLLDLVGRYLNLNYMYDPADVTGLKGEVSLKLQGPIKVKDLYLLAESVLKFKGFVMTRKVDLITIVPKARSADIDAPIVDPKKPRVQAGNVIITRIFELEHIAPASAKNLLDSMKLGVNINTSISELGKLIVTGYAYRMSRIEQLLEMVDKPGELKKFRSRPLKYTMAKTLAAKVKTLAEQLGTVSIAIAAPAPTAARPTTRTIPGRPPTRTTRPPTPTATPAKATVYLDADERTNRILMIGLEEQLAIVDKLIDALDVEKADLRALRLYEIQHVDAEDVRTKLEELGIIGAGRGVSTSRTSISRTTLTSRTPPRTPTTRPTTTTTPGAVAEPLVEEPQVVIIEATNSLLVNATAEQHIQIAVIIGYVDAVQEEAQNPYVIYPLENQDPDELAAVLEKLILETITEKSAADSKVVRTTTRKRTEENIIIVPDTKSYSLIVYASKKNQQWIASLIEELDEYRPQVLLDVTLVEITKNEKFDLDLDAVVLSGLPNLGFTSTTGAIGEVTSATAFYQDKDVDILLTALQEKGYGRILARPKLLVNDNEEGTIKTEEQTSVAQVQTQYLQTGTGQVPSYSPQTSVSFQSYTAGITLTITPHISKGDQLGLTIALTRSDFRLRKPTAIGAGAEEDKATYPTPPDLLTSDVTTKVTVPDGTTIILGGLERITQIKGGTKVPILGDIPILGGLFRTTSNQDDQSRLYVFVRANIIRPGDKLTGESDIEIVSLMNRARFEKYEKEMQEYEDWPGIKPKPMDPERILEADEDEVVSVKKGLGI